MLFKKVCFYIALGLLTLRATIDAVCKECSPTTHAACLNETAFEICFDGATKSGMIGLCGENRVCTAQQGICKLRDATTKPQCGSCGVCYSGFACISQTEFEFCDAGANRIGITAECSKNQLCSILNVAHFGNICMDSCGAEPTCYAVKKEPTETPGLEYTKACTGKSMGYYENTYDSTCTTYVYCEVLNGVMHALLYNCTSGYFSADDRKCTPTKPSRCS